MASILSEEEAKLIRAEESKKLKLKKKEFAEQGKKFTTPNGFRSGVMPEDYRANLPGKKEGA